MLSIGRSHDITHMNRSLPTRAFVYSAWVGALLTIPCQPSLSEEQKCLSENALITISLKKFNYNTNILISSWNKCRLSTIEILHCYLIPYKLLSNMTMMFKAKRNENIFLQRKSLTPGRSQIVVTNSQFWMVSLSSASTYST